MIWQIWHPLIHFIVANSLWKFFRLFIIESSPVRQECVNPTFGIWPLNTRQSVLFSLYELHILCSVGDKEVILVAFWLCRQWRRRAVSVELMCFSKNLEWDKLSSGIKMESWILPWTIVHFKLRKSQHCYCEVYFFSCWPWTDSGI